MKKKSKVKKNIVSTLFAVKKLKINIYLFLKIFEYIKILNYYL